ncbi:hypothetical protein HAX54_000205 [Datura stramonium]|uniref:Uncharacterized protein n=1 Tax=Datura stramonium TaxID=4076 RepID=A0ABS8WTH2_DATST|nr:hypothetical protein [Datura stramonium]
MGKSMANGHKNMPNISSLSDTDSMDDLVPLATLKKEAHGTQAKQGKEAASISQVQKRFRTGHTSKQQVAPLTCPEPTRKYVLRWVEKEGQKWFKENKESKRSISGCSTKICGMREPINVGVMLKLTIKRVRVHKGLSAKALCRVGTGFAESVDDDIPTIMEKARQDLHLYFEESNGEDLEIGDIAYGPTDDDEMD